MQAATEVQRVLDVWARRIADRSVPYLKLWSARTGRATAHPPPRPRSLRFWDFHGVLTGMGVNWLSLKQQRLLFQSLDSNRDGRVDVDELQNCSEKRVEIELRREELMIAEQEDAPEEAEKSESEETNSDPILQSGAPETRDGLEAPDIYEESDGEDPPKSDASPVSPGYSASFCQEAPSEREEPEEFDDPAPAEGVDSAARSEQGEPMSPQALQLDPASEEGHPAEGSPASEANSDSQSESRQGPDSYESAQSPGNQDSADESEP